MTTVPTALRPVWSYLAKFPHFGEFLCHVPNGQILNQQPSSHLVTLASATPHPPKKEKISHRVESISTAMHVSLPPFSRVEKVSLLRNIGPRSVGYLVTCGHVDSRLAPVFTILESHARAPLDELVFGCNRRQSCQSRTNCQIRLKWRRHFGGGNTIFSNEILETDLKRQTNKQVSSLSFLSRCLCCQFLVSRIAFFRQTFYCWSFAHNYFLIAFVWSTKFNNSSNLLFWKNND